ncbi:uncharacterized sodium-dependent transporter HI_0736-like isoform X2 [Lytechinus variegatus]|nr:uncharacterized sodium-dependent transporter HI_0736-like isoform X2 [Lytechinus variegatus]
MVGTGNIWRFPRILANNSGDEGCLQFLLVWLVFLFIWSIPIILIEYGTGRYTKKGPISSFKELAGPKSAWAGGWIAIINLGISGYYCVILGWCIYYLFFYMSHDLPGNYNESYSTFYSFTNESAMPVLFHAISILLSALIVLWGVKSIELVSSIIVSIFLLLIIICFIWSLTLPNADDGIRFLFTPDWVQLRNPRMWVDAISQNAFDTGAAAGLFVSYAAYMTAETGIVRYGILVPIGNNIVSLICGMLTYATVFSTQSSLNKSEIVDLLGENGPGNTGLTFIWFPIFFNEIGRGGRFVCVIFFISIVFAGLSSLTANVELLVKVMEDFGLNRKLSTLLISLVIFLLGIGSALSLNFLINQDFVWGFGLLIAGLMFLYLVIRVGPSIFRRKMFNEYSVNDWHLYAPWDWMVMFIAPIEAVILIIWWAYDTISDNKEDWYQFLPESFMATVVQWVGALIILITINILTLRYGSKSSSDTPSTHLFIKSRQDPKTISYNTLSSNDDDIHDEKSTTSVAFTNDNDIGTVVLI